MSRVILFGFGRHAKKIAASFGRSELVVIAMSSDEYEEAEGRDFELFAYDEESEEELFALLHLKSSDRIVVLCEEERLSLYVTLSLKAFDSRLHVTALAATKELSVKLRYAGADTIVDLYEASAVQIGNLQHRPWATRLLDALLFDATAPSFHELLIAPKTRLDGAMLNGIDFDAFGVKIIGLVDCELGNDFRFLSDYTEHKLDCGDTLVCVAKAENFERFREHYNKELV